MKATVNTKPKRSLIVIQQSIVNITRQNTNGQYNALLEELEAEKRETEQWVRDNSTVTRRKYVPCPIEKKAIAAFYSDNRYTITE